MSLVQREEIIAFMEHDVYRPLTVHELEDVFEVTDVAAIQAFANLLQGMEDRGDVVRTRANRYGIPERMNLVVGSLQMKARGFGFVIPEDSGETDVYVSAGDLNGAMSGDRVMVRVEKSTSGPRREGKIIRVLERSNNRAVGKVTLHGGYAFVSPLDKRLNQDIFIPAELWLDAHDGDVVVVEITEFPTSTRGPEGRVVEVLGNPDAPGVDILAIVRKFDLPEVFPPEVLAAAEAIPSELAEQDYLNRRDLRGLQVVTIDGDDAKDLDDAVHVHLLDNGNYLLGVHIADVGYYVPYGGELDQEAFRRGTSVYLVDRVIPMLPQRLSNGICSLNPRVDRLTLSCEMEITRTGEIVNHDIFPSVICTAERMTYTAVRKILVDKDAQLLQRYQELVPMFQTMQELASVLREARMRRGAIDFDFDEVKVQVDDLGRPLELSPIHRSVAERLIEEFMLAANETVAQHFHWLNVPFVYRVHESPDLVKMQEFNEFISNFGYHVRGVGNQIHPRALQFVLHQIAGTREEPVISHLMLRSMRQARYAPESLGHFGLAAEFYSHFTSPIRRYPDLTIHRIMREALAGTLSPHRQEQLTAFVAEAAKQSSLRERVAQDAERETSQLKMVEYMLDHLGETFDGIISGVTQFGLFVHLANGVEGLIHVSYLTDDYYVLNEKQMALVGERTRRVFRLGDPVQVEVTNANREALTIDFALLAHHREGTLVKHGGVETVEYDEDLSPKERQRREQDRTHTPIKGRAVGWQRGGSNRDGNPQRDPSGDARREQRPQRAKLAGPPALARELGRAGRTGSGRFTRDVRPAAADGGRRPGVGESARANEGRGSYEGRRPSSQLGSARPSDGSARRGPATGRGTYGGRGRAGQNRGLERDGEYGHRQYANQSQVNGDGQAHSTEAQVQQPASPQRNVERGPWSGRAERQANGHRSFARSGQARGSWEERRPEGRREQAAPGQGRGSWEDRRPEGRREQAAPGQGRGSWEERRPGSRPAGGPAGAGRRPSAGRPEPGAGRREYGDHRSEGRREQAAPGQGRGSWEERRPGSRPAGGPAGASRRPSVSRPGRSADTRSFSGAAEQAVSREGFELVSNREPAGRNRREFSHGQGKPAWGPAHQPRSKSPTTGAGGRGGRSSEARSGPSRGTHPGQERGFVPSGRPSGKNKGKHIDRRAH
ncbi:ribonuclease R [Alicyclobacillaceae bacterium I2511]|nr:ribonuclease R [Alicyclobacillaceae bacterium I2511]